MTWWKKQVYDFDGLDQESSKLEKLGKTVGNLVDDERVETWKESPAMYN
jgi:hypothetical protein